MSNNYLNKNTIKLEANYYAIQESFLLMCDLFFNQTIKKEKLLKLYSNAQFADDRRKKEIRDSLYEMLITDFEYLKTINVRQLHFYLPDNTSFLRFNKPQKYGDNLTDIRYSVKMTNKNLKKHSGFEEGCVFNGLRNVYPLLYNNEHIGSVEISLSFDAIKKQLLQNDSCSVGFMIRKDVLEKKVFISEKNNYIASLLSEDFLHEKEFLHYNNEEGLKVIDEKIKNKIKASLSENKSFTVYQRINDKYYLISFVSIKNIEKKAVAYIFSYKETNYISKIKRERIMLHILAFLVIALFVYLLVKIDSKREVIKKQNRSLKESKNELQQTIIHLKKANENTEESEQKFRDLSNLLPVIIYEVDLEGNFMFLNKQSFKSFGYDKKIFEDKINVLQMVIAKDRDKAKQKMYEILSQGTISSTEYTALRKDGSTFPALVYSGAIVRNNKTIGIRGAMIDISELKNTEHKLIEAKKEIEKSEQKFRDLFEKSGDAMLIIENGVFVDCNQSAIDLLEYKAKEDIINLRPKEISPEKQPNGEKSRTEEIKMIDLALKNGTHRFEWIHKKKNGKLFPVEIVLTAI
ncbi:MAG: PAS domain S-box protein, partial [Bacteroidota bacterium]|nr:PAS domain S-box protein [Bacteroidota bacterium]